MKYTLGLDIGTNSIGAALIGIDSFGDSGEIKWIGSRIVPLDGDSLSKFENGGQTITKAADRRRSRGSRRLKQRYKLRRTRLIRILKALGWVPKDFPEHFGKETEGFNINKLLPVSAETREAAYAAFGTDKISEDWLVYFLRKKALTGKITLQELARILYMMNQRRGFKSSRKEIKIVAEEETKWPKIEKWNEILTVSEVSEIKKEKDKTTYRVLAGDYAGEIVRRQQPDWLDKTLELEITRKMTKSGEISYSFKTPDKTDWERKKEALHRDFYDWRDKGLCTTVGEYFLDHLLADKNYRIRQQVIERTLYREELEAIWKKQSEFHPSLSDRQRMPELAGLLYSKNEAKQKEIAANDLLYLFANDIIYYQRPLKSQKHLIDGCRLESKSFFKDGVEHQAAVKVAPRGSPEAQEIRIWQDIHNLRIFDTRTHPEKEITEAALDDTAKAKLYALFDENAELSAAAILKALDKRWTEPNYRINLFANREKLKGNETKAIFRKIFRKHGFGAEGEKLLTNPGTFYRLWHTLYSIPEEADLKRTFLKQDLPEPVAGHLSKLPELPKSYSAYSSKAIKKMLPLMRCGAYWNGAAIDAAMQNRIEKLCTGEWDEAIDERTRQQALRRGLTEPQNFRGLPVWLATYVVYGRHSERSGSGEKYQSYKDIDVNKLIKPGSLRNPLVETIIRETLALVKDICEQYSMPDEIHVELARELKKTAEEKKEIADAQSANNAERERIRILLLELRGKHGGNPQSGADVEKFRLWKAAGGKEAEEKFDALFDRKNGFVKDADIERYRLWADQHHCSPYTGKAIGLSDLFDRNRYEVEHIFPRMRFFDDSFANKVICEAGVNKQKDREIARLFIQKQQGVPFNWGGKRFITLSDEDYVAHCKRHFHGKKLRNLLAESIPEEFVSRQLNDTRHISRRLAELLAPVAREKEGIVFTGGSITSELKEKWGLQKVWKELLLPRFERLSELTGEALVIPDEEDSNKFHFAKEYKRVDHRHHALDALIIAATQRSHIQYLNTLNALSEEDKNKTGLVYRNSSRKFVQPWPSFVKDTREALQGIIVSHKASNRVVSRPFNKYLRWIEQPDGSFKKGWDFQQQPKEFGKSWTAVRRSMFKEPQGIIYLKEIVLKKTADAIVVQIAKQSSPHKSGQKPADYIYDQSLRTLVKRLIEHYKGDLAAIKAHLKKQPLKDAAGKTFDTIRVAIFKEYAAKRVSLDKTFDEKKINRIPYSGHQPAEGKKPTLPQQLRTHLNEYLNKPELAFEGEGLETLHKKLGFPLEKVTVAEEKKNPLKIKGGIYETDDGSNVFFLIRQDGNGNRKMTTIPLTEAIVRLSNKLPLADELEGYSWFTLSPNELVYVPDDGEDIKSIDWRDKKSLFGKVFRVNDFSGTTIYFVQHNIAKAILPKEFDTSFDIKSAKTTTGIMIKERCIKLRTDRLGNIQPA